MSSTESSDIDPRLYTDSNTAKILATAGIFCFIALVLVSLRIYTRLFVVKSARRDDWTIVAAMVMSLTSMALMSMMAVHGLGRRAITLSAEDMMEIRKLDLANIVVNSGLGFAFVKISVGFTLLRFSTTKLFTWSIWILIAFVVFYSALASAFILLTCRPIAKYWDRTVEGECTSLDVFLGIAFFNITSNMFTDVVFATMPVPVVWKLKMKLKVRLYLIGALSLGYTAVVMGLVKSVYMYDYKTERDETYEKNILTFASLELNFGIIATCLPTLRPLVGRMLKINNPSDVGMYNNPSTFRSYGQKITEPKSRSRVSQKGAISPPPDLFTRERDVDIEAMALDVHDVRRGHDSTRHILSRSVKGGSSSVSMTSLEMTRFVSDSEDDRDGAREARGASVTRAA